MVFVKKESLEITEGKDFIGTYYPEEGYKYKRDFCIKCGTSLGEITSEENSFPIPANTIDGEIELENSFHEFISDKPKWL